MSTKTFGKHDWVAMFREIGLDEGKMHRWHAVFEERWPEAHRTFLERLGESDAEISRIRQASRDEWSAG